MELTQTEPQKEKRILERGDRLRDLSDSIKQSNIHIIGVPKGKGTEERA